MNSGTSYNYNYEVETISCATYSGTTIIKEIHAGKRINNSRVLKVIDFGSTKIADSRWAPSPMNCSPENCPMATPSTAPEAAAPSPTSNSKTTDQNVACVERSETQATCCGSK